MVTLHVSVWVEMIEIRSHVILATSRSTWACELKFNVRWNYVIVSSHAPRERVSWNLNILSALQGHCVTLHVSVWVEMTTWKNWQTFSAVTLHVSVWVEMIEIRSHVILATSRSTWACELKFNVRWNYVIVSSHAPRERVSWNLNILSALQGHCVTLHVSVWVEITAPDILTDSWEVTLHVSVWVEIFWFEW